MLVKDIRVGGEYWTYVSQEKVKVRVVYDYGKRGKRYTVRRVDNGETLKALRSPGALHMTRDFME